MAGLAISLLAVVRLFAEKLHDRLDLERPAVSLAQFVQKVLAWGMGLC
jgi:hypothetical protein